ncbi:MAG: polysaccharide biosynthesis protein [Geobacteraceae bacterium]|nr:polysaccharide biosynthesis protein [Geobacteraceae bacterium]
MKFTPNSFFRRRRLLVFGLDVILIGLSFFAAFLLRFDFSVPSELRSLFEQGLLISLLVKPVVFLLSGLYRSLWRYASLQDGVEIAKVVTASSVISGFLLMYLRHFAPYPRSIFILDWFLLLALIASSRLVWRVYRETVIMPRRNMAGQRTLIVGAGEAGSLLLKEIRRQQDFAFSVVGFVDDDPQKAGMKLHGVAVLGTTKQLAALISSHSVEDVIIAIPTAAGNAMRDIVRSCEHCKVRFKTLPAISDIIEGKISVSQIKDVDICDLLGRDPIELDQEAIRNYLEGKRVLVTGAAGSIGSEICRQVARYSPAKLVLLDSAETPLYHIEKELTEVWPAMRLAPVLADVRQAGRLDYVFETFLPEVVFHAAAYKHVPMIEYNPVEAVTNNILGTRVLAEKASAFRVQNFVMISTDKAVNPTNVMGASKRAAELYVQALARKSQTHFTTVRFGNVLGSNGSVIPLFKEQIAAGGPVTVTHPDVIRYFMTIPEASQLVLQAGCIGNGGEIFVLDMGKPVKIVDLAEELISLSGLTPHEDIEIVFTGLRPGEKLYEELLVAGEGVKPTAHHKIKVLESVVCDLEAVTVAVDKLKLAAASADTREVMDSLKQLVPEFSPQYAPDSVTQTLRKLRPDIAVE